MRALIGLFAMIGLSSVANAQSCAELTPAQMAAIVTSSAQTFDKALRACQQQEVIVARSLKQSVDSYTAKLLARQADTLNSNITRLSYGRDLHAAGVELPLSFFTRN